MCTAMLYDPKDHYEPEETTKFFEEKKSVLERLMNFKRWKFLQPFMKSEQKSGSFVKSFFSYLFHF
jgi:hypothetical protein